MTLWSRWLAGATLSLTASLPTWCAGQSAVTLPPAPVPDPVGAPRVAPAPSYAPRSTLHPGSGTVLAPSTQLWADQAVPQPPAGYPGYGTPGTGPGAGVGPFHAPGGYEPRVGSPYYYHDPNGGQHVVTGNPYYVHFGPGYHRHSLQGHYRFPYYNYRAPWYYPGRAVYNRDTNQPW